MPPLARQRREGVPRGGDCRGISGTDVEQLRLDEFAEGGDARDRDGHADCDYGEPGKRPRVRRDIAERIGHFMADLEPKPPSAFSRIVPRDGVSRLLIPILVEAPWPGRLQPHDARGGSLQS